MRRKRLVLNTCSAILNQIVTLICGFVLPRLIIVQYGSAVNGLLSSITQFLAFFALMEMGVGAVVRASLYKPLAEHDNNTINRILLSSRRFFRKIGIMLGAYSVALMTFFPALVDSPEGYLQTSVLVGAIAFSSIAQYMFGIVYQQLLNADQRSYVQLLIASSTVFFNTLFSVLLIKCNASIQTVKLFAALLLLLRPLLLKIYVDRHYQLNFKLKLIDEPLKQKWNGFAQHIATYVLKHADTVVLTVFSTLENVSIYYIYHLVTNGMQQIMEVVTIGVTSLLGNMYAKNEVEKLNMTFSTFEWLAHTLVIGLYVVAGVLILPFVSVYTKGITDVNYIVPVFAVLIVAANSSYCLRIPYYIMVQAAGHFKQTQTSSIIEASLNVIISIALVHRFGLAGVAVGTLIAMTYRTVYLAWYLRKSILNRSMYHFFGHLAVDILTAVVIILSTRWLTLDSVTYRSWIMLAVKVTTIALVESIMINFIFYRRDMKVCVSKLFNKKGTRI